MSEENHNYREKSRRQKQIYLFYFGSNPHDSTGLSAESEYSPREIAEFMTDVNGVFMFTENGRSTPEVLLFPVKELRTVEKPGENRPALYNLVFVPSIKNYEGVILG